MQEMTPVTGNGGPLMTRNNKQWILQSRQAVGNDHSVQYLYKWYEVTYFITTYTLEIRISHNEEAFS
jgi:hypothetical protein